MKINKFLITLFCTVFFSKIDAMFLPFPYVYMSSTVVVEDRANTILSRKWVNWLYAQNSSITTHSDIRSNIDYYHEMIKSHYDRLLYKKQNNDQIKKAKLKRLLWSTGINASIWATAFISFKNAISRKNDKYEDIHFILSVSSVTLGFFSLMLNCLFFDSYRKHDLALSRNIKRDEHMLKQFEEYKATMNSQNRSVKQETT